MFRLKPRKEKAVVSGIFGGAGAARDASGALVQGFQMGQQQFKPFQEAGVEALNQQRALLGLTGPEEQEAAFASFAETPGQQFLRDRQQKALLRNAAAIGGLGGGNIRTALQQQAADIASTEFGNQFSRLGQLRTGGQQAAGGVANLMGQAGQARAQGILGAQQANQALVNNLLGIGGFVKGFF